MGLDGSPYFTEGVLPAGPRISAGGLGTVTSASRAAWARQAITEQPQDFSGDRSIQVLVELPVALASRYLCLDGKTRRTWCNSEKRRLLL
jgi:hypothetical protein